MTKQLFAVKGKMTMADVLAKIARENLRIEQNAAKPPTIAQDTSIMDDLAAIQSCADNMALPLPAAGTEPHPLTRSFAEANGYKENFEDKQIDHGY